MRFILFFLITLLSFSIAKDTNNTLEIGFVYWKKKNAPEKYNAYLYGINKAIEEINKKGGLGGFKLKVVPFNEKGKVEESIKIAKEIAKRNNMIAVIGFSNSKRAIPSIKYVSESNIPIISSAGSSKIFLNDVNKTFFTTNFGIKGEIQYLKKFIKVKGYDSFIFISKKGDAYSEEYYKDTAKILKDNKKIWASEVRNKIKDIKDFIKKHKNTFIIISVSVSGNAKIAKLLRDAGIKNDIFLGRGGIVGEEFYKSGGYKLKNIYELSTLLAGVSNETLLKFKNDNIAFFKNPKNKKYLEYAAYAYDIVHLIEEAYKKAADHKKITNPKEIREIIKKGLLLINEQHPYEGVATTYSFDKNRIGGKLIPQYILESTGKKPSLYKKQFIYQRGVLTYVPTLYTNIDIKSIDIDNQEASRYTIEMMITLISEQNITLNDIEFENIVISDSSFKPSIYAKEFYIPGSHKSGLNVKIYNVKAYFKWNNSIEDFPFDSQKLPIIIKPKNPVDKNFINFFISDIDNNLKHIEISGWDIIDGYAGFKKGSYEYIGPDLEKQKKYYYRSSFTIEIKRKALSSALKFILPLAIVLLITIVLFALPDNAGNADKVGSATNMLITVAALYFTYATLVEVDYLTFVDWLYMGSLGFVLIANVIFILRQRFYQAEAEKGGFNEPCFTGKFKLNWIFNQKEGCKKVIIYNIIYLMTFLIAIFAFGWAILYFLEKAQF